MTDAIAAPNLTAALRAYIEARSLAFVAARKTLKIGDLDARALIYVVDHPGTRPGELADYLGITSAGVTTLVDRLIRRGAIEREPDTVDRRVVRLNASVDLGLDPWSELRRFDTRVDEYLGSDASDGPANAIELLAKITAHASTS